MREIDPEVVAARAAAKARRAAERAFWGRIAAETSESMARVLRAEALKHAAHMAAKAAKEAQP